MTHLAVHSSGHEVRTAQLALNIYFFGRRAPPLAMDGIFGGLMKRAVEDFQRERHIANDPSGSSGTRPGALS